MYEYVRIIYISLGILNVATMIYFGLRMSKSRSNYMYWRYAIYPIITYCIFMGLRFGRMIDYNLYADRYTELGKNILSGDYEPLFRLLCFSMWNIGLPYQCFILLCSFLMIYSVFSFVKDYKVAMPYMLLFFLWETTNFENYIRWYLGVSFFLFFVAYLYKGNHFKYILFAVIACFLHIGMLPIIIICFFLSKVKKIIIHPLAAQTLMILSVYMGSIQILSFLNPYIGLLGIDQRAASYTDRFNQLINGDLGKVGIRAALRSTTQIRIILAYSFPLYIIPLLLRERKLRYLEANMFSIGIIIAPIFAQVEILDRFGSAFLLFSIIVSGCSYYYVLSNFKKYNDFMRVFCVLSLIAYVFPIFSDLFNRKEWYEMLFIWDAHGRDKLPIHFFLDN